MISTVLVLQLSLSSIVSLVIEGAWHLVRWCQLGLLWSDQICLLRLFGCSVLKVIGPVYEVRRGTWFIQDGSSLKPCEENLATQLEDHGHLGQYRFAILWLVLLAGIFDV
jgi:hypothetical protein